MREAWRKPFRDLRRPSRDSGRRKRSPCVDRGCGGRRASLGAARDGPGGRQRELQGPLTARGFSRETGRKGGRLPRPPVFTHCHACAVAIAT